VARVTVPDAILAMIRSAVPEVQVYDSGVPDQAETGEPPPRYAVVWPNDGDMDMPPEDQQVAPVSTGESYFWQVSSVAPDRQMAAWIARTIRLAIVNQSVIVDGFSCGLIRHQGSFTPDRDENILSRRSVLIADRYTLLADRHDDIGS